MKKSKLLLASACLFLNIGIISGVASSNLLKGEHYIVAHAEEEVKTETMDFTNIEGFAKWESSYKEKILEYDVGNVTLASANRQTGTITNMPVTKGGDVSFVGKGITITKATLKCLKWGSKSQTITAHYSTDGGKNYTSTGEKSSTFELTTEFADGVNAIKYTFSSSTAQIGISSLSITYKMAGSATEKTFAETFTETSQVSSQLSFGFTKENGETPVYTGFNGMSLNFKTNVDFTGKTKGTDFTEAGMMFVKGSDVSATYSKKTAVALPEDAKKATQTDYSKEFIVRLGDIPVSDWETDVTVVPYILIDGTYYFGTASATNVIEVAGAYSSSEATITLSDESVVNVKDVAAAIEDFYIANSLMIGE